MLSFSSVVNIDYLSCFSLHFFRKNKWFSLLKIVAPFWDAIFGTQQTTRPEILGKTLLWELNLALVNNIYWPWIPPAVSCAGRVPFDWSGKIENTSSTGISTLQMLRGLPHFIEIFLYGWSSKHSKPRLGMAFWRKKIIIRWEICLLLPFWFCSGFLSNSTWTT